MTDYKLVPAEPTDDELLNWAAEEQLFLQCEDDDFLQIAREVLRKYGSRSPAVQGAPVARVKTVGGYLEVSEHVVEWLCKHKDLKDGDYLYLVKQPAEQQPFEWPRLDRPAKVGAVCFGKGVSSRLVIEAAQRQYEYDVTPEKEAERIAKFADSRKEVLQPLLAAAGLVEALESSPHGLHGSTDGEECLCSQCKFVKLRDAALSAYRKQGAEK